MKYESVCLRDVCRITAGFAFKRNDFCGDSKVIKTGSISALGVDCHTLPPVSAEAYDPKRMTRFLARQGDCVLTMRGPRTEIVKVAMVKQGEAYVNQGVTLLSPGPQLDGDFLFHILQRNDFKQYIKKRSGGHKNRYVRAWALGGYPLRLPPLSEQKKMVLLLRRLDERWEQNRCAAEKLEEQAMALYQTWFESFEAFGGRMPEDWDWVPLRRLAALIDRGVIPEYAESSPFLALNQRCIRDHGVDLSLARTISRASFGGKRLQYGDILINSTGVGSLGRTAQILFEPNNLTVDSHITIVRPIKEELTFYLGLWAWAHEDDFVSMQTGNTSQTELPRRTVRGMKILLPDGERLRCFNRSLEKVFADRAAAIQAQSQLEEQKEALLRRFVSEELAPDEVKV